MNLRLAQAVEHILTSASRKVEPIKIHYLVPGRDKVMDKLLLGVRTCIDFSESAELGV